MKKLPTCIYVWNGETMQPTLHFARLAETSFTSGQAYRLIVAEETETIKKQLRRSKQQNDKMWAMLGEISDQAVHCSRRFSPDQWKVILLHALGKVKVDFLPALDNQTFIPYGGRSSHMTLQQMAEFIEYLTWFGTQHGVKFRSDEGLTWEQNA